MSTSPLHHKNVEKEIYDILSVQLIDGAFKVELTFGPYQTSENANDRQPVQSVWIEFVGATRFDYYADEGYDQSFQDSDKFKLVNQNVPGVMVSKSSRYFDEYKKREEWAAVCNGTDFKHFVVWSYGCGVIHILSDVDPIVGKISNAN